MSRILKLIVCALLLKAALPGMANAQSSEEEKRMFALNLYHEARSQGKEGMIAIAWVVLNRVDDASYPNDVIGVITQKRGNNCEWGWWCDGKSDEPTEAESFALAKEITDLMLSDDRPADPTNSALWFHEDFRSKPSWMKSNVAETARLGKHIFYGWAN